MSNHLKRLSNTKIYRKYRSMLERCNNKNHRSYMDYGGRGIKVCEDWSCDIGFLCFYDWAMKNGYKDELTLERIDVDGDYCPENCKWIPMGEQQRNKRSNVIFEKDGKKYLETDLAKELGVSESTIRDRILRGKDVFAPKFERRKMVIRDDGVIYQSIREAARENNAQESKVGAVCRGVRNKTVGHSFRFLTKEEAEKKLAEMEK